MLVKKKIIGTVCALTILGVSTFSIAYADEVGEAVKEFRGKMHKSIATADFSENENLTDATKKELVSLQTELKELKDKEKDVEEKIRTILNDNGITLNAKSKTTGDGEEALNDKSDVKRGFIKGKKELSELTDEEKEAIKERMESTKFFNKDMKRKLENKETIAE